jgi:hypothetical protein
MAALTLHIASGDLAVPRLLARGLEHVVPWREALADGPVTVRKDELIPLRQRWISQAYSSSTDAYDTMVTEVVNVITDPTWEHIVLHFDTDLFCVVNALFVSTCCGHANTLAWEGGGEEYALSTMDRAYLRSCWQAYAGADPTLIEERIRQAPPRLAFVARALRAHCERFPSTRTGLGAPEDIVAEILDRGLTDDIDVVQAFTALDANRYGWGDVQILRELRLVRQIRAGEPVRRSLGGVVQTTTGPHWQWDPLAHRLRWSEDKA